MKLRKPRWNPERYWLFGMAALFPAWLVAFLGFLTLTAGALPKSAFIGSSALPLVGAIITDAVVRRLRESGRDHQPMTYWLLGVTALVPGWIFVLLSVQALT